MTKISKSISLLIASACMVACFSNSVSAMYVDREDKRVARRAAVQNNERKELTPDEELIYAIKGYKSGAALLIGMINPLIGTVVACAPSHESDDDLIKIRYALSRGANVNCRYIDTWTPLLYAAYEGYPGIAKFLLEKRADKTLTPTQGSWKGYTSLDVAEHYLKRYTANKKDCKPDMVDFYEEKIQRYSAVVRLLK